MGEEGGTVRWARAKAMLRDKNNIQYTRENTTTLTITLYISENVISKQLLIVIVSDLLPTSLF